MGTSQSREDRITDSDSDSDYHYEEEEDEDDHQYEDVSRNSNLSRPSSSSSSGPSYPSPSLEIEQKLSALKLKYSSSPATTPHIKNAVKLHRHIGGNTPKAKWIISDKLTSYKFVKTSRDDDIDDYDDGEESDEEGKSSFWYLCVGSMVKAVVETDMRMKMFGEDKQRRVEFVSNDGVWGLDFLTGEEYKRFVTRFQDCLFENVYK